MDHAPTPTQGEEETAREIAEHAGIDMLDDHDLFIAEMAAALRQRADEATRTAYEECAAIAAASKIHSYNPSYELCGDDMARKIAAAIRARIAPKGEP